MKDGMMAKHTGVEDCQGFRSIQGWFHSVGWNINSCNMRLVNDRIMPMKELLIRKRWKRSDTYRPWRLVRFPIQSGMVPLS